VGAGGGCNFFHIASDSGVLDTARAMIGYAVAGLAVVLLLTPNDGPAVVGLVLNGRF